MWASPASSSSGLTNQSGISGRLSSHAIPLQYTSSYRGTGVCLERSGSVMPSAASLTRIFLRAFSRRSFWCIGLTNQSGNLRYDHVGGTSTRRAAYEVASGAIPSPERSDPDPMAAVPAAWWSA